MPKKSLTKDERFLVALYQRNQEEGVDPSHIATLVGLGAKGAENVVRLLAQANFIRKEDDKISLTERGKALAESLLSDTI